jgi:hypothetical protein
VVYAERHPLYVAACFQRSCLDLLAFSAGDWSPQMGKQLNVLQIQHTECAWYQQGSADLGSLRAIPAEGLAEVSMLTLRFCALQVGVMGSSPQMPCRMKAATTPCTTTGGRPDRMHSWLSGPGPISVDCRTHSIQQQQQQGQGWDAVEDNARDKSTRCATTAASTNRCQLGSL